MLTLSVINTSWWNTTEGTTIFHSNAETILDTLNYEKALHNSPIVVFLAIVMIFGTAGNTLVLYVYNKQFRKQSTNLFISLLAIYDLIGCLFVIPFELSTLSFSHTFINSIGCKMFRFIESFTIFGSSVILVEIAFDRYYKICKPLRILKLKTLRYMCCVSLVIAILFASPAVVVNDISYYATHINGTFGYACTAKDKFRTGTLHRVSSYFIISIFLLTLIALMGFYIKIWREIRKRGNMSISDSLPAATQKERKSNVSIISSSNIENSNDESNGSPLPLRTRRSVSFLRVDAIKVISRRIKFSRTFVIFLCVSAAFVISYFPGLIVLMLQTEGNADVSVSEHFSVNLFSRFYVITFCINPLIYGFLNPQFRKECKVLDEKIRKRCRQKGRDVMD